MCAFVCDCKRSWWVCLSPCVPSARGASAGSAGFKRLSVLLSDKFLKTEYSGHLTGTWDDPSKTYGPGVFALPNALLVMWLLQRKGSQTTQNTGA
jgi:hypothetical protein